MTIYNRSSQTAEVLNARETAPGFTTQDMFLGNGTLSTKSPLAVAVPGEVAGYWEARRLYGNSSLSWQRILQPTIDMCRNGIPVSWSLAHVLATRHFTDPEMILVFIDPDTGEAWKEGKTYTRPVLADTLELLAIAGDKGDGLFYKGYIAEQSGRSQLQYLWPKVILQYTLFHHLLVEMFWHPSSTSWKTLI